MSVLFTIHFLTLICSLHLAPSHSLPPPSSTDRNHDCCRRATMVGRRDEMKVSIYGRRPGSSPPNCAGICNDCRPCLPVRVPISHGRQHSESNSNSHEIGHSHSHSHEHQSPDLGLMEYYPETWKCKCKNKIFIPSSN